MDESISRPYLKVVVPSSQMDYESGKGEPVFVTVDRDIAILARRDDAIGGVYEGVMACDSLYYPDLKAGSTLKFELRGEQKPMAILSELPGQPKPNGNNV